MKGLKIQTKAVHAGDRQPAPRQVPVTVPIYTAASFIAQDSAQLDRIFGHEEHGYAYSRYDNPTAGALEELITRLENGAGTLCCASGMLALQTALQVALLDRPKRILAAESLYGATVKLLLNVLEPWGVSVRFADSNSPGAFEAALAEFRPGCVLVESISNPLLRVCALDRIADACHRVGAALVVDNTFATPLLLRPLELGADFSVHSLTKYLAGHGDVLGGSVTASASHLEALRSLGRTVGPGLGPFECYLAMRGIKTFPLRVERQCANAHALWEWLQKHPRVERTYYPADPSHPDAEEIRRLLPPQLHGGMVSFELKGAGREEVFAFLDRLQLVVKATSLGDVHTMVLYPVISSHRDVAPRHRERMGIRENLVRVSAGIEATEDILADLEQALS